MTDVAAKKIFMDRIEKLFSLLAQKGVPYDTAVIISKVNQYYFTGTLQDGLLVLQKNGQYTFFVRKSFARAIAESPLDQIYEMSTYRDMQSILPTDLGDTYIETEIMPLITLERLRKYFTIHRILPLDKILSSIRAVKSDAEIAIIAESGRNHQYVMENIVPTLLREGISETDFAAKLYSEMVQRGHHGVSRFSMFQMEMIVGQIGFGETSIYPTNFDGPGGMLGMSPAVPLLGNRDRCLRKGDIVFVDVGYGMLGYHSDKTQIYSFGQHPAESVCKIHRACMNVLTKAAALLLPGNRPSEIYREAMDNLPPELENNFMGYGKNRVSFLGHGVGLYIDEQPIIAPGQEEPLSENMVIALEPKCGIEGVGTVGVEETYVVKKTGAICLTGSAKEIITI